MSFLGRESKLHFKKIYIYDDAKHTYYTEWIMSQKGFNLLMMQFPLLDQKKRFGCGYWQVFIFEINAY